MKKILIVLIFTVFAGGMSFAEGNESGRLAEDTDISSVPDSNDSYTLPEGVPLNSYGYRQINPTQLKKMLENKNFDLINVHIPYQGDIPKTDANIAFNRINDIIEQYPDKGSLLVLYCMSGPMSRYASRELVKLGYTNIVELTGGSNEWRRLGNNLIYRSK